jgi:hypothetical protein
MAIRLLPLSAFACKRLPGKAGASKTASDLKKRNTAQVPSGDAAALHIRSAHRSPGAPSTNLHSGSILDADTGSIINAY